MGEKRNAYRLLVGNPERKRPLGSPRHKWVNKIQIDLLEPHGVTTQKTPFLRSSRDGIGWC
jgi:hypothetical protein